MSSSEVIRTDSMAPEIARKLAGVLGDDRRLDRGDPLPLLWHWAYFADLSGPADIGVDGHPTRHDQFTGRYPRRMAGGGRITGRSPFRLGVPATRRSQLEEVTEHEGRSGPLAIAVYSHVFTQGDREVRRETQTVIYRGPGGTTPGPAVAAVPAVAVAGRPAGTPAADRADPGDPGDRISFDPVMLFRFSAATWNAHRIHYDRGYAVDQEGYPGLVVHGPLLATLLFDRIERRFGSPCSAEYRAQAPVFDTDTVSVEVRHGPGASSITAEIVHLDGKVAMSLTAQLDRPS
jgi:3-methylfumaryl-CoA hydratase